MGLGQQNQGVKAPAKPDAKKPDGGLFRSPLTLGLVTMAVVAGLLWAAVTALDTSSASGIKAQIARAKSLGLPLTPDDMKKLHPPVEDSENAALYYRRLGSHSKLIPDGKAMKLILSTFKTSPGALQSVLDRVKPTLDLMDQASRKKRCWFKRDWTLGSGLQLHQYSQIRQAARMVMLRARLERQQGRGEKALESCRQLLASASHMEQELLVVSRLVGLSLRTEVADLLSEWGAEDPSGPWLGQLEAMHEQSPTYTEREAVVTEFYFLHSVLEDCRDARKQQVAGLPAPSGLFETLAAYRPRLFLNISSMEAMTGFMKVYGELDKGKLTDPSVIREGNDQIARGLRAIPDAATMYGITSSTKSASFVPFDLAGKSVQAKEDLRQQIEWLKRLRK